VGADEKTTYAARGFALAVLASVLWGLTPVAVKGALAGYSPEMITVLRLGLASLLFRYLAGAGAKWLPRERWTCIAGVALGVDFLVYNRGVNLTTASVASLVVNIEVVSTIAFALWLLGERLTVRRVVGALVTLGGAVYVATEGVRLGDVLARERVLGNALVMFAGVSWSLYAVAQRRAARVGNLFALMTPIFVVAMITTLPGLALPGAWRNPAGATPTLMLGALIFLSTFGVYVVYARSQELLDVSVLAIVLTSIPIFTIVLAWLLLGESISTRAAIGGAAIVIGVLVIASERAPATIAAGGPD
jgi:drug/metabolite transporter (DMT)-like permease